MNVIGKNLYDDKRKKAREKNYSHSHSHPELSPGLPTLIRTMPPAQAWGVPQPYTTGARTLRKRSEDEASERARREGKRRARAETSGHRRSANFRGEESIAAGISTREVGAVACSGGLRGRGACGSNEMCATLLRDRRHAPGAGAPHEKPRVGSPRRRNGGKEEDERTEGKRHNKECVRRDSGAWLSQRGGAAAPQYEPRSAWTRTYAAWKARCRRTSEAARARERRQTGTEYKRTRRERLMLDSDSVRLGNYAAPGENERPGARIERALDGFVPDA
ncbi:hypothetical protein FB451DRAFT_1163823 [Mycena latifolia]|nr:hypothetical protein FB451DRAFT_1163823 [Mycena latifolia]